MKSRTELLPVPDRGAPDRHVNLDFWRHATAPSPASLVGAFLATRSQHIILVIVLLIHHLGSSLARHGTVLQLTVCARPLQDATLPESEGR